jgi:hypothetical protein
MWIGTDDKWWYDKNWTCYVDWKEFERKFSRKIWANISTATDLEGCWHDLLWGAMWIGTNVKECCHDLILSAMWIGNDVTGSLHEQFELICGLHQMIKDDVVT